MTSRFRTGKLSPLRETLQVAAASPTAASKYVGSGVHRAEALAFDKRGKPKDAYDLFYVIRHHIDGVEQIATKIRGFGERADVNEALAVLRRDFRLVDSIGPVRVAEFLGAPDPDLQADVAGLVRELLDIVSK
ncbi:MAG: hypothetical protein IPM18_00075 [Phycisphaerales bacterium]|nr:hypothetical protein [Phycisphaerales bacterium]